MIIDLRLAWGAAEPMEAFCLQRNYWVSSGAPPAAKHRSVDDVLANAVQRYLEGHSWTNLLECGAQRAKTLGIGAGCRPTDRRIAGRTTQPLMSATFDGSIYVRALHFGRF